MKRAFNDVPVNDVPKRPKIESNIQNGPKPSNQNDRHQTIQNDRQQTSQNDRPTSSIIGFGHLMNNPQFVTGFSSDFSSDILPSNLNVWSSVCRNKNPNPSAPWNQVAPEGPKPGKKINHFKICNN